MVVLKNISKSFQKRHILKNVSFHIGKNETVGIVGLNGAGKTTLLNVISGLIEPDSGFIRVGGAEVLFENKQVLKEIAYVSGSRSQLWNDLYIKDSLSHCMEMYGISKQEAQIRLKKLDDVFEINTLVEDLPQNLSLGERMRCELVYALLSEPQLLLVDEALIGLDVSMKHKIMEYLENRKNVHNSTMIYTSHNLLEIEKLCDRILLIDHGSIIFDGTVERLMQDFSPLYHMDIVVEEKLPDFEDLPVEKMVIENIMKNIIKNIKIHIVYDKQKIDSAQILAHVMDQTKIVEVQMFEPNLEETIKTIYARSDLKGNDMELDGDIYN